MLVTANRAFDVFYEDVDPELLQAPVNTFRLALHPKGIAPRVGNLPEWGRHITENLRARLARSPDPSLEVLLTELESYLPPLTTAPDVLGFAVPLELDSRNGHLRLITTLTSFATATDITLAELNSKPSYQPTKRQPLPPKASRAVVTIDDAGAVASTLARSYEAVVRDQLRFRVGQIVYVAFSRDETLMGFAFPKDEDALVASEPNKFLLPRQSESASTGSRPADAIGHDELHELIVDAWRMVVPKKVSAAYHG